MSSSIEKLIACLYDERAINLLLKKEIDAIQFDEDKQFKRWYGAAMTSYDLDRISRELSSRLYRVDRRAKAANARADYLEKQVTELMSVLADYELTDYSPPTEPETRRDD